MRPKQTDGSLLSAWWSLSRSRMYIFQWYVYVYIYIYMYIYIYIYVYIYICLYICLYIYPVMDCIYPEIAYIYLNILTTGFRWARGVSRATSRPSFVLAPIESWHRTPSCSNKELMEHLWNIYGKSTINGGLMGFNGKLMRIKTLYFRGHQTWRLNRLKIPTIKVNSFKHQL